MNKISMKNIINIIFITFLLTILSSILFNKEPRLNALINEKIDYLAAAAGVVEPKTEERQVSSEIIGIVKEVLIEENDKVKANQIIAIIKNDNQKSALNKAKAGFDSNKAIFFEAEKNYNRSKILIKDKIISQKIFDEAQKNFKIAKANLKNSEAIIEQAKADFDKTLIRSPIEGTVLKKEIVAGSAVTNAPPTTIAFIGDVSSLRIRAEVDELDIAKIKPSQKVLIKSDAYPDQEFYGTVVRVNKRLGPKKIQTDRSNEKIDNKVLQCIIELDDHYSLPVGLRVDTLFLP